LATLAQLQAELAKVDAAIDRITGTTTAGGAQGVSMGGVSVTRADLAALYKRKEKLELSIARLDSTTGGISRSPVFSTR
jgi:hypothetical protein